MQRGGSLTQTAYALLSDLVTIARRQRGHRDAPARVEALDGLLADDRHRNRAVAARDELVVRRVVFVDVLAVNGTLRVKETLSPARSCVKRCRRRR